MLILPHIDYHLTFSKLFLVFVPCTPLNSKPVNSRGVGTMSIHSYISSAKFSEHIFESEEIAAYCSAWRKPVLVLDTSYWSLGFPELALLYGYTGHQIHSPLGP